ncbi:MAG: hypothetical protein KAR25_01535 [Methanosarcinales archaeon]|nr:hypothetical protein [Methanosarcinales archaeon]
MKPAEKLHAVTRSPALIYTPPPTSEPRNYHVMPESQKHQQERPITDRSGQLYPGEIAAGGPEAPAGLPGAKTRDAWGRALNRKPHAKTKEDAAATAIEANRELTHHLACLFSATESTSAQPLPADASEFV